MSRRSLRLAVVGGAVAAAALSGGTAFAADAEYPLPPVGGDGGGNSPVGGGTGNNGGLAGGGTGSGGAGTVTFSNGGEVSGGGSATTDSGLPFTGFELATAIALGVGAVGAGSVVVVAARRRRDSSALA